MGKWKKKKQVRLDNDASELDILGHIGTFWDFLEHLAGFRSHFQPFSPIIGSSNKCGTDGPTDRQTDSWTARPFYRCLDASQKKMGKRRKKKWEEEKRDGKKEEKRNGKKGGKKEGKRNGIKEEKRIGGGGKKRKKWGKKQKWRKIKKKEKKK